MKETQALGYDGHLPSRFLFQNVYLILARPEKRPVPEAKLP